MIVAMKHEKRRFVENVDFITSPGWIMRGGRRAREAGLPAGGMFRVVTELAVFGFDEDDAPHDSRLRSIRASRREQVQDNTGFELEFTHDIGVTEPPTEHELSTLRMLDPERLFTA